MQVFGEILSSVKVIDVNVGIGRGDCFVIRSSHYNRKHIKRVATVVFLRHIFIAKGVLETQVKLVPPTEVSETILSFCRTIRNVIGSTFSVDVNVDELFQLINVILSFAYCITMGNNP